MQCTRIPTTQEEEQREEVITTQTATVISTSPGGDQTGAVEQQLLQFTESDHETVRLIPDCLEHIFKYLSTTDKGRVAQVRRGELITVAAIYNVDHCIAGMILHNIIIIAERIQLKLAYGNQLNI